MTFHLYHDEEPPEHYEVCPICGLYIFMCHGHPEEDQL